MNGHTLDEVLTSVLEAREKHAQIETNPKGFFVHVRVPEHVAERLRDVQKSVLPADAETQDIDHITLVYTKKALEDHPPTLVHGALDAMRAHGETVEPIDARIQGWAYFDGASKDGKPATALVALVDAPGLEHLHVDLARKLDDHGIRPSTAHVFTPHITLGYLPQHGRATKDLPPVDGMFMIDTVHVASRDHHEIPLTGGPALGQKAAAFALRNALPGALLGSAAGAGASMLDYAFDSADEKNDDPLLKRVLRNGAMGAIGGGVIGAANHAAPQGAGMAEIDDMVRLGEEAAKAALE